jgi:hypothetical protein
MASATGVCSNFGLSGYGSGDRGLSPDGADDKYFCEGRFALHSLRAKVAAVAALALASTVTTTLSFTAGPEVAARREAINHCHRRTQ